MSKKCKDCKNTGYVGGGKSGIYCHCMKGTTQELKDGYVPTFEDVKIFAEKHGYRGGQKDSIKDAILFYKRVRERHQYNLYFYELHHHGKRHASFCVEMIFNTGGDHWANIQFYSIPWQNLQEDLKELEQRLLQSVTTMGGHPQHYDPE